MVEHPSVPSAVAAVVASRFAAEYITGRTYRTKAASAQQ